MQKIKNIAAFLDGIIEKGVIVGETTWEGIEYGGTALMDFGGQMMDLAN